MADGSPPSPADRGRRVGELINLFFDRRRSGEQLTVADFVADYPDLANELTEHLEGLGLLEQLSPHDDASDLTATLPPAGADEAQAAESEADAGSVPQVPGYTVMEELGRGGMGVVYKAVQLSTKRTVALKVLLEGPFASPTTKRRFEREIELAAQLQHPNIVGILDSGVAHGRYYFAMHYLRGQRLDAHLQGRKTTVRQAVQLFAQVCDAIAYAHRRGVIHRDLKPSNILIDRDGQPHVLDFGLAKVAGEALAADEPRLLSQTGQLVGTLPYMAPEQALGAVHEIDMRADVYALGVIFYQVFTGKYPYEVQRSLKEALQNIAHAPPIRPRLLNRHLDDEIETIQLKCLEKEPPQRYQTAGELAGDLHRYLSGEPIEAKRASGWYVFRKLLARHRLQTQVAMVLAVVLIVAGIFVARSWSVLRDRTRALELSRVQLDRAINRRDAALRDHGHALRQQQLTNEQLRRELHNSHLLQGRLLLATGKPAAAADQLWREYLLWPDDPAHWALWELSRAVGCRATLTTALGPVHGVAFSPDGRWLAAAGQDRVIRLYDRETYSPTIKLSGHEDEVMAVAFSPDGRRLVSGGQAGSVLLWSLPDGRLLERLTGGDNLISSVGISTNNLRVAAADWSTLKIWNLTQGPDPPQPLVIEEEPEQVTWQLSLLRVSGGPDAVRGEPALSCLAFTPDGRGIATGNRWGVVKLTDAATGQVITTLSGHPGPIRSLAFAPGGEVLAAATDRLVRLWHWTSGQLIRDLDPAGNDFRSVGFSTDGTRLVVCGEDGATVWKISTHAATPLRSIEQPGGFRQACISADGAWVATASGSIVQVWQTEPAGCQTALTPQDQQVTALAVSSDGRLMVWGTAENQLCIAPPGPGPAKVIEEAHWQPITRLAVSADATYLASASGYEVALWRLLEDGRGQRLRELPHTHDVEALAFSPTGKWLATAGQDEIVRLWPLDEDQTELAFEGHEAAVRALCFSKDGRWLLSGSQDGSLLRWVTDDPGQPPPPLRLPAGITAIADQPEGEHLAVGCADGSIWLLQWSDWQVRSRQRLAGHQGPVVALCFCPRDPNLLVSAGQDQVLTFWSLTDQRELLTLRHQPVITAGLGFLPEGRWLLLADLQIRQLDLDYFHPFIRDNLAFRLQRNLPEVLARGGQEAVLSALDRLGGYRAAEQGRLLARAVRLAARLGREEDVGRLADQVAAAHPAAREACWQALARLGKDQVLSAQEIDLLGAWAGELSPRQDAEAWRLRQEALLTYYLQQEDEEALQGLINEMIEADRSVERKLCLIGVLMGSGRMLELALPLADQLGLSRFAPEQAEQWVPVGQLWVLSGQAANGAELLTRAARAAGRADIWWSVGWALEQLGQRREADAAYRRALIRANSRLPGFYESVALFGLRQMTAEQFSDRWKDNPARRDDPWFFIGERYHLEGDLQAARQAYGKCIDLARDAWPSNWAHWRLERTIAGTRTETAETTKTSSG